MVVKKSVMVVKGQKRGRVQNRVRVRDLNWLNWLNWLKDEFWQSPGFKLVNTRILAESVITYLKIFTGKISYVNYRCDFDSL